MHTNAQRMQTTFVIGFKFCPGGRAQHRILASMWENHFDQMLQTEPFLSVVMNKMTCMISVLLRFLKHFRAWTIKFSIPDAGSLAVFSSSIWSTIIPCSFTLAKGDTCAKKTTHREPQKGSNDEQVYTVARKTHTMCTILWQSQHASKSLKSALLCFQ